MVISALLFSGIPQTTQTVDTTFERLVKIEKFAFGPTGFVGAISLGEKDYKIILARPSAMADFERLYLLGNLPAKCYALVGIRRLNPQRFKELAQPLNSSKEHVVTMRGCIVSHESLGAVLKQIESGKYSR